MTIVLANMPPYGRIQSAYMAVPARVSTHDADGRLVCCETLVSGWYDCRCGPPC